MNQELCPNCREPRNVCEIKNAMARAGNVIGSLTPWFLVAWGGVIIPGFFDIQNIAAFLMMWTLIGIQTFFMIRCYWLRRKLRKLQ